MSESTESTTQAKVRAQAIRGLQHKRDFRGHIVAFLLADLPHGRLGNRTRLQRGQRLRTGESPDHRSRDLATQPALILTRRCPAMALGGELTPARISWAPR